jgi:hypothetical protein
MKILNSLGRSAVAAGLLLALAGGAGAAEVQGLFEAVVSVDSRDDERQRQQAFVSALREVLIKLTGHADVAEHPVIQDALRSSPTYVETWAYRTQVLPGANDQSLTVEVQFYQAEIERLLDRAGIALWPRNRPETLVWMVVQNELGERSFADPSTGGDQPLLDFLRLEASRRGLPLATPLFDFDDQRLLRPDQLWALDGVAIQQASARYPVESVLAIRVLQTVSGDVVARSVHFFRNRALQNEALELPAADFLSSTVSLVARELADNYGVLLTAPAATGGESMVLTVDGVQGLGDYAALLDYLGKVPGISRLQVREVAVDRLAFSFTAAGQVRQLVENLALNRRLQTAASPVREAGGFMLRYRWQPE